MGEWKGTVAFKQALSSNIWFVELVANHYPVFADFILALNTPLLVPIPYFTPTSSTVLEYRTALY